MPWLIAEVFDLVRLRQAFNHAWSIANGGTPWFTQLSPNDVVSASNSWHDHLPDRSAAVIARISQIGIFRLWDMMLCFELRV